MKGLLYKPENFDPAKKYPMIVYYYERYSDKLNTHYVPNPSRSTVNFPYYNSNGYLVFVPDIIYTTGHPGKDAYNSIMSGTMELMKRPYVDEHNMGLQGQSWAATNCIYGYSDRSFQGCYGRSTCQQYDLGLWWHTLGKWRSP